MLRGGQNKNIGMFILFLVTGAIIGGILGELINGSTVFVGMAPYLVKSYPIVDVPPMTLNLYVIRLVIGFGFYPNLVSILGIVIAGFLYRRF